MGISNGIIKNDQITATSKYLPAYQAYTARLKLTGARWCSAMSLDEPLNYSDYLQVDFKANVTLTGIATQGDDAYDANYVRRFYLEVSLNGFHYKNVTNGSGIRQVGIYFFISGEYIDGY